MAANGDIETGGSAAAAGTIAAATAAAAADDDGDAELDEGDGVDVADEGGGGGATRLGGCCSGGLASWEASSGGGRCCWGGMASGRIISPPPLTGIAPGGGDLRSAGLGGRPQPQPPPLLSPSDILRPPGPLRPFIIVTGVEWTPPTCR